LHRRHSIMSTHLNGKHILIITSNTGIERDELVKPL
jgi:protease I